MWVKFYSFFECLETFNGIVDNTNDCCRDSRFCYIPMKKNFFSGPLTWLDSVSSLASLCSITTKVSFLFFHLPDAAFVLPPPPAIFFMHVYFSSQPRSWADFIHRFGDSPLSAVSPFQNFSPNFLVPLLTLALSSVSSSYSEPKAD